MANYTKSTNFTAKDALSTGDPNKLVKGSEHDAEYDAIETSSATKANKIVSGVTNNVIKQSAGGDLTDSGYSFSGLVGDTAVTKAEVDILDGATVTTAEVNRLTAIAGNGAIDAFPTGTLMLFQQTAAPTGWTKQTTHNDKALRVVSGTVSSGGTSAFSTVFGKTATDSHTLLTAEIPSHAHTWEAGLTAGGSGQYAGGTNSNFNDVTRNTSSTGGGGGHAHNMDIRVQYVDLIIASKD